MKQLKECSDCNEVKPMDQFYKSMSEDGHRPYCKTCTKIRRANSVTASADKTRLTELHYDRRMRGDHRIIIKFLSGAWPA